MKKLSYYFTIAAILFMTTASTCSNDDDTSSSNPQPVINTATDGSWRVTYYYDTDSDDTSDFNNYTFTFGANNVLTATNGTNTYTGSWSVTDSSNSSDDDSNDDDSNDLDFNISFTSPSNFAELTDDWDIITYSSTQIKLVDVSGGNGGTDYLTFEKIN